MYINIMALITRQVAHNEFIRTYFYWKQLPAAAAQNYILSKIVTTRGTPFTTSIHQFNAVLIWLKTEENFSLDFSTVRLVGPPVAVTGATQNSSQHLHLQ